MQLKKKHFLDKGSIDTSSLYVFTMNLKSSLLQFDLNFSINRSFLVRLISDLPKLKKIAEDKQELTNLHDTKFRVYDFHRGL